MTRRLPWARSEPKPESGLQTPVAASIATPASAPAASVLRSPLANRRRVFDSDPLRSPSTSPPPEAPKEQFMIPGVQHDDRFRMVEDEFLHTAQKFTTHLHRAEYERLKALAKRQNAATIREIERPVVAMPLTQTARTRREAEKRAAKQRQALREAGGDDGSDKPWLGTTLYGLMESPRKEARHISAFTAGGPSRTRAAAGFDSNIAARSSRQISPSPAVRPFSTPRAQRQPPVGSSSSRATSINSSRPRVNSFQDSSPNIHPRDARAETAGDVAGEDDPFGLHQRRAHRMKSREQLRRQHNTETAVKKEPDTIPSFL